MFMVLGGESSGKSTILERITMLPLFPRAEVLCTRMPIKVQLRNSAVAEPATLRVQDTSAFLGRKAGQMNEGEVEGEQYEKTISLLTDGGQLNTSEDDVREEMESLVERFGQKSGRKSDICSDKMIILTVKHPQLPTLDLIDLPGLIAYQDSSRELSPDLPNEIEQLATKFVHHVKERSDAFILAIVPDGEDPRKNITMQLLRKEKVIGKESTHRNKVLGIFSRADLASPRGGDFSDKGIFESRFLKDLSEVGELDPFGWTATMNAMPTSKEHGDHHLKPNGQSWKCLPRAPRGSVPWPREPAARERLAKTLVSKAKQDQKKKSVLGRPDVDETIDDMVVHLEGAHVSLGGMGVTAEELEKLRAFHFLPVPGSNQVFVPNVGQVERLDAQAQEEIRWFESVFERVPQHVDGQGQPPTKQPPRARMAATRWW